MSRISQEDVIEAMQGLKDSINRPVKQLTDDELEDVVRATCEGIIQDRAQFYDNPTSVYQSVLHGVQANHANEREMAQSHIKLLNRLVPYAAELFLRGLTELQPLYAKANSRTAAVPVQRPLISSSSDVIPF